MHTAIAAPNAPECRTSHPLAARQHAPRPAVRAGILHRPRQCSSNSNNTLAPPCATRRDVAVLAPVAFWTLSQQSAAGAAEAGATAAAAAAAAPPADAPTSSSSSSSSDGSAPSPVLQRFFDNEYELQVPSNYTFLETPIVRVERGPQPERSPVLARFEAPNGQPGSISILKRKANALKQTILQVADITQLGNPIEVAQLILPRGSTLLAAATQQVAQPTKETPLGTVELPPQTYYTYEFTTPAGLHVALAAGARKGSVYICGASTQAARWQEAGPVFGQVARSFRIRAQPTISIS